MQPIYLTTEPTANASCMCLKLVLTSHKNICKIVKQKIAQKKYTTYDITISFYDIFYVFIFTFHKADSYNSNSNKEVGF